MKQSSRALTLAMLRRWRNGTEFADRIVAEAFARSSLGGSDRGFALELFYGALRNLSLLDFWMGQLRPGALEAEARDLLRLGLYQIMLLEAAPHAAVFETVELARGRARALVNAILRRALREKTALLKKGSEQPVHIRFSQPEFLIAKWNEQFGAEATLELCRWNNQPAPIYARMNQLKTTTSDFLKQHPGSSQLKTHLNFARLPGLPGTFESGDCYIQDPSTALACELLQPSPNETVLDACAAPGGKTAYLAEMMRNEGALIGCDSDPARLERLRPNLVRLGVSNARVLCCDWSDPGSIGAAGFGDHSFDKILVDAPCTNTGVMRRRVDVRWRLRRGDFARMHERQSAILRAVAPLLKPGGTLVYSTCSLEPEENEGVIAAFLRGRPAFSLTNREQSLPFRDGYDGAFATRVQLCAGGS